MEAWGAWSAEGHSGERLEQRLELASAHEQGGAEMRARLWREWCRGAERALLDGARAIAPEERIAGG
eukprot:15042906-Alexandrium_andersonii.AAC.1